MQRLENIFDYLFNKQRWAVHLFYWGCVFALYVIFFGRQSNNYSQTFFFIGVLLPITIGTVYFVNYFLVPRYLLKEFYLLFVVYFIYTVVVSVFLGMITVVTSFILLAEVQIKRMNAATIDFFFLLASLVMIVFLSMAIKLLLHWRQSKEAYEKLMREKVETELLFLKAQLNPHFLFNTLNNLYFLTSTQSERAPQAVMQLSEMLDYVMHASRSIFVPLENEWRQVENYIALELLRCEDRVQVQKRIDGELASHTIGPMLLLTLVENAFKHGVLKMTGASWVYIFLTCNESQLEFMVKNSRKKMPSGNGLGLSNLKNQLVHLYGEDCVLSVDDNHQDEFSVTLTIQKRQ